MLALVTMKRPPRQSGFTLIELMITVAIVAILAAIVIPSYNAQVRQSRRSDAVNTLLQISQELERCRSDNNAYTPAAGCQNYNEDPDNPGDPRFSPQGFYRITANQNATSYTLTATAVDVQANDDQCVQFTLDQTGAKNAQNSDGDENDQTRQTCWRQ